MHALNLPSFDYRLKKARDKVWIFDGIRKKFVVLTPEEWVRQHFVNFLVMELKYPRSLVKIEGGLAYNDLPRRSDVVVFDREGNPWMLIECKASTTTLSDATLHQVAAYNATLRAKYITISNGMVHYCAHIDWVHGKTTVLQELPAFNM